MLLTLYVAWPAEDRAGHVLRRALDRALAALPGGSAGRRLVSVLIDAAAAPPPGAVAELLAEVGSRLAMAPDLEATLSVDPRTVTAQDLAAWRGAGINRMALRAAALDRASEALLAAASALFPSCAVDLTFGRPRQTLASWQAELRRARRAGAHHISIEEHVPVADEGSAHVASLYQGACVALGAGMPPYEIGHFAELGHESRHMLHGATGGDYLGIGPGAVGRIVDGRICHALTQVAPVKAWLRAVESGTETEREVLSRDQRQVELMLTGLRLRAGIERAWFEPLVGRRLEIALDRERLAALVEDGFLVLDRQGLRLSERGWPLCDAVLARLLD